MQNYRSLRELRVPLTRLTVVIGANGTGKSSLYRALRLLADCAEGRVVASLAREGGQQSTLWAGPGISDALRPYESVLTEVVDPRRAPEVIAVREQVRSWRFYDQFRTDETAPARQTQIGTRTSVLAADGRDLAAALQTIIEVGDYAALARTVADAFLGSRLQTGAVAGRFDLHLSAHGLLRPLNSAELSDGTLRYLLLVAALLSPRPPSLLVLNEPETSLHPELLAPLARLVIEASEATQIIVVSHSEALIRELRRAEGAQLIELIKDFGETRVKDRLPFEGPV